MSFSFEAGFLELAETLCDATDEASLRTGTSRAYYAAFHAGKKLAVRRGFAGQGFTTHSGLWQNFNPKAGVKRELWPLFTKAKRLQEKRETADYQETSDGSIDWARECKSTLEEQEVPGGDPEAFVMRTSLAVHPAREISLTPL